MSTIRRQSIISSLIIYFGFAVGFVNVFFFTSESHRFTEEQYGLTTIFVAIASLMSVFAVMAMPSYILKFYHYYNDHLPPSRNDMVTWALLCSFIGFALVMAGGWFFKDLVIRKFGEHSPILVSYYYWIFPMGFGLTIYTVLEAYTWAIGRPVITSFLREVQWRVYTTVLIVLVIAGIIKDYDLFIKLYAFSYPCIAITLLIYLVATKKINFTFRVSKISRRYLKSIVRLCTFLYAGTIVFIISQVFDTIVIASVLDNGAAKAGIFGLAQIMASIIQAPQRGIVAASVSHLSRAWKDKNMVQLQRIYQRSSINQLVFATGLFILIALNYKEAIITFKLKDTYLAGFNAFLLLGIMRIVDMGTGVNAQIITTSNYWRFELVSGVILIIIMLPLTLMLTRQYDIMGPAIANLISVTIYNIIRIFFLWRKFRLFPFTIQSLYTVLLAGACFVIFYYLFRDLHGLGWLVIRSTAFIALYGFGAIYLKLSPDIQPVLQTIQKRIGMRSK
jgi:O-antigen/teichoic acid export membrane protein